MEPIKEDLLQALILTKNEEPNLLRVLNKLTWLQKVIIVDSYSNDATLSIARSFPNVVVYQRPFDTFAKQCNHGLSLINSQWVLSMDADYVLTDGFIKETEGFVTGTNNKVAYYAKFEFLIFGRQLISNNTTPRAVLFKHGLSYYFDDGHAHRLKIEGGTGNYKSKILHDDRKPLSIWVHNQDGYAIKECKKLSNPAIGPLSLSSKIRKNKIIAPFLVFFHCLFVKRLIFNGWIGWHYTLQRTMVEILLAIRLIETEKLSGTHTQNPLHSFENSTTPL
jgi:glycosyltransferase involved in cell wall biosynthesis